VPDTKTLPREKTHTRLLPPYHVIILNDDHHTVDFVVAVLRKALGYSAEHAYQLMLEAHETGRSIVWTGPKEVAELKCEQIQTFHQKPFGPLGCVIEPACS
jgi:ATP-dependent Clp protease adaptor protein ClpS